MVILEQLRTSLADRYRIERELGAGGMATVYLAEDLKHDRKVAIKVLKPELAAVLGAERFIVEIKTTASLQHPHILPLFDSGTADGQLFYVMPYIQGETIRERLNRETQFAVDDAVRIAREVADALDYAHRHGVIHRDIKPENILLHDGRAIVMDFGIALAVSAAAGGRMTETGLSLGTPHYMSPEQATAEREITARSDVYSLASVLYEMLTGDPPFTASSAQAVIMKIITEQPAPVTTRRRNVPPNVAAAVARALEKLPADRFENAKDFADALVNATFALAGTSAGDGRVTGWQRRAAAPLAAIATIAIAAALWGWRRPAESRPVSRYLMGLPDSAQVSGSYARIAATADGSRLVYRSGRSADPSEPTAPLWVRERDQLEVRKLAGTEAARAPFFSPDGQTVAYFGNHALWAVRVAGGQPTMITSGDVGEYGGSWSRDGIIYMDGAGPSPLLKVSAVAGSKPERFTRLDSARGEDDHVFPEVLPNGKGVLFIVKTGAYDNWQIAVADAKTGTHHVLARGVYVRYAKSGHLLIVTASGGLMAVRFDQNSMRALGEPVVLEETVGVRGYARAADLTISDDGTLIYSPEASPPGGDRGEPVWVERDGRATPVAAGWTWDARYPALSPDGRQLAVSISESSVLNLWVRQLERGTTTKLTHEGGINWRASWLPDGDRLLYLSDRRRSGEALVRKVDGTGVDSVAMAHGEVSEVLVTKDGKWIVYRLGANTVSDLYARRTTGDTTPVPLATSEYLERNPEVSPDGRFLAYMSNETGVLEVYLRPFPNANDGKWAVSTAGGLNPLWSRDGKELFYRNGQGDLVAVEITATGTPPIGRQRVLFSALPYTGESTHRSYDITPDGKRFVMIRKSAVTAPPTEQLIVVENFFDVLRRKVPR